MLVSEAILTQLANWGVKRIYGVAGDHIFHFLDQLSSFSKIEFHSVYHEEIAALMASAHAKLTGEIGVCLSTGGPGAVHLLNGVADAYKDRVPLLAITGDEATKYLSTDKKQVINQSLLFSGVTCFSGQVVHEMAAGNVLEKALTQAVHQSMPAHISISKDILKMPYSGQIFPSAPYIKTEPQSCDKVINKGVKLINQSKKPAILVGKGGVGQSEIILKLADKCNAPVVLTAVVRGEFPHEHPLVIGGVGAGGSEAATKILNSADLVLEVGANWWPVKYLGTDKKIIKIDSSPASLAVGNPIAYGIVGDTKQVVEKILKALKINVDKSWIKEVESERSKWLEKIEGELKQTGSPCPVPAVINSLNNTVANDAIITLDVGDHFLWFNRLFKGKGQTVLLSGKWRTLGFGLPAALAAKFQYPKKQVLALVGDGGFLMVMQDFLTAVKNNLAITVVVINNKCYAMEKNKMLAKGLKPFGTELHTPDFKMFAESCGGLGFTVNNTDELDSVISKALKSKKPCIVDIHTEATPPPTEN